MHGYLVSITSQPELDFVVAQFGSDERYHIGLTGRDQEGIWLWKSGEQLLFPKWASGEPNNSNGEIMR